MRTGDGTLDDSFVRFAEAVAEHAFTRVRTALELESDRHGAAVDGLEIRLAALERQFGVLQDILLGLGSAPTSFRVDP